MSRTKLKFLEGIGSPSPAAATIAAGDSVEAALNKLQGQIDALKPIAAAKLADESRASSASVTADSDLHFVAEANATYRIRIVALLSCTNGVPDFRWSLLGPASPVSLYGNAIAASVQSVSGIGPLVSYASGYPVDQRVDVAGNYQSFLEIELLLSTGAAGGTVSFGWAQWSSNSNAMTVQAGSTLTAQRIP